MSLGAPQSGGEAPLQAAGFPPVQTLINPAPSRIDPIYSTKACVRTRTFPVIRPAALPRQRAITGHRRAPEPTETDAFRQVRNTITGWFAAAQARFTTDGTESTNDELGRIVAVSLCISLVFLISHLANLF